MIFISFSSCRELSKWEFLIFAFLLFFPIFSKAQDAISASGGNGTGNGGTVSFTVGQTFYTTYIETSASVSQGVQHAYEIMVISSSQTEKYQTINCKAFPNPVTDKLVLNVEESIIIGLSYSLFDLNGKLLETKSITSSETMISMKLYISSSYILKVMNLQNKELKTFNIIKR